MIQFKAFIKDYGYKGLISGDKGHRLLLHELEIDRENIELLAIAPTDKQFKITMELEE